MKKSHLLAAILFSLTMANIPAAHAVSLAQLEQSAQQGNAVAEGNLGYAYANGQGVPQNYAQALYWWRKAAAQGNATAIQNLRLFQQQQARATPPQPKPVAQKALQDLSSFWTMYFQASHGHLVDFGEPTLVQPVAY